MLSYHREVYERLLEFMKPGVTLADVVYKTHDLGKEQAPKSGPLAGAGARMVCHGRRLGDNVPLATNDEAVERYGKWQFPENGVFIIKPNVFVDRVNLGRGDSCRITANGAVRMGNGEHAMIIAK